MCLGAGLDTIVATHAIDPSTLRTESFDDFFATRTERLLELVSAAMGKEAIRDDASDEGDVDAFEPELEDLEPEFDTHLEAVV